MNIASTRENGLMPWISRGVKIENYKEDKVSIIFFISIPERSELKNYDGQELSGYVLTRGFKATAQNLSGPKNVVVKSRTRVGETWTKDMSGPAMTDFMEKLSSIE